MQDLISLTPKRSLAVSETPASPKLAVTSIVYSACTRFGNLKSTPKVVSSVKSMYQDQLQETIFCAKTKMSAERHN